jgi:hypothetical protein
VELASAVILYIFQEIVVCVPLFDVGIGVRVRRRAHTIPFSIDAGRYSQVNVIFLVFTLEVECRRAYVAGCFPRDEYIVSNS